MFNFHFIMLKCVLCHIFLYLFTTHLTFIMMKFKPEKQYGHTKLITPQRVTHVEKDLLNLIWFLVTCMFFSVVFYVVICVLLYVFWTFFVCLFPWYWKIEFGYAFDIYLQSFTIYWILFLYIPGLHLSMEIQEITE